MTQFFYDQQIRRLILQVIRMFSGFVVITGKGSDGQEQFRSVPVRWGQPDRMTAQILRLNSENKILTTPIMSVHITGISMASDRRQDPTLVRTDLVDERKFDSEKGTYTKELGDRFTIKRYMPVPYNFTFQLDIWTSNQDQKMQILEQIMMLFNPAVDLQTSDNALDWTAITFAQMEDNITWTNRSVPLGTDEPIDVATMSFLVPFWINPPAEVTRRKAIETIITKIQAVSELPEDDTDFAWNNGEHLTTMFITPGNHSIIIDGNEIILAEYDCSSVDDDNNILSWKKLLNQFKDFWPGISILTAKRKFGDADGITGVIDFHPTEQNKLLWSIDADTLPANTLSNVDAIIDPFENYPGHGLTTSTTGQRYLIVKDMTEESAIWGITTGKANDIIEYNGTTWIVSFNSQTATEIQIVLNNFSNKQFRFNPDDQIWELAVDGCYKPGTWKISSTLPLDKDCE